MILFYLLLMALVGGVMFFLGRDYGWTEAQAQPDEEWDAEHPSLCPLDPEEH